MSADYYSEREVRGRRAYPCAHCARAILMGELHVVVAVGSRGEHRLHRAHGLCHRVAVGRVLEELDRPVGDPVATVSQPGTGRDCVRFELEGPSASAQCQAVSESVSEPLDGRVPCEGGESGVKTDRAKAELPVGNPLLRASCNWPSCEIGACVCMDSRKEALRV
jgi:hypothetical protein